MQSVKSATLILFVFRRKDDSVMDPKIGIVGLAGKFEVGFEETPDLMIKAAENIRGNGGDVTTVPGIIYDHKSMLAAADLLKNRAIDILCVCVGTWSEDHHLLDLLEYIDRPVMLWAFPAVDTGSLCGVQQICCVLKELGKRYFYLYGESEDRALGMKAVRISKAAALKNKLRHVKIGNIGGRVKGMTETAFDEMEIKEKTGVRIAGINEQELAAAFSYSDKKAAEALWDDTMTKVGSVKCSRDHGVEAMRYYLVLKDLIIRYDLEGLAVRCYPELMGRVCLPFSILSAQGIVCGCEGDINNTVAMKILYELSSQPVHNTDLLYPKQEGNTILFSHCGSGAFCLAASAKDITLGPVRLADTGVCSLFPAKPGKVTLINLTGRRGTFRMSVLTGEALECGMEFPGNPLKVRFEKDIFEINERIAEEGTGHHWMAAYGDYSFELKLYCELCSIQYIEI